MGNSLTNYSYEVMKRDGFICRYCGLNGARDYDAWLTLSRDHLLPKGHPSRDDDEYIVTACNFCNTADNQYFNNASKNGITFDGKSQVELVEQRKKYVTKTRETYHEFWLNNVSKPT